MKILKNKSFPIFDHYIFYMKFEPKILTYITSELYDYTMLDINIHIVFVNNIISEYTRWMYK